MNCELIELKCELIGIVNLQECIKFLYEFRKIKIKKKK